MPDDEDERFLTPADIRERLKVSLSTAYKVVRQCARVKFGKSVRVTEAAFQAWLRERTEAPAQRAPVHVDGPRVRLTRWPDGSDPRPPRKPKPKIGVPRAKAKELREQTPLVRPRRSPDRASPDDMAPIRRMKPRT